MLPTPLQAQADLFFYRASKLRCYESISVQELRLEEIHHYVNTDQDKIARVVMMSHLVRTSCKAHATVTVYIVYECLLSNNSAKAKKRKSCSQVLQV